MSRMKRRLNQKHNIGWQIPLNQGGKLKVGDYVAVDPRKIRDLLNFRQISDMAKSVKNKFYLLKLDKGMATLTRSKWSSRPTLQLPISSLRAKLKGYQEISAP